MKQKLTGWKANFLSLASRRVLIQSSLAAIPSYIMQCSYLPGRVLDELDRVNRFSQEDSLGWLGEGDEAKGGRGFGVSNSQRKERGPFIQTYLEVSYGRGGSVGESFEDEILQPKKKSSCKCGCSPLFFNLGSYEEKGGHF